MRRQRGLRGVDAALQVRIGLGRRKLVRASVQLARLDAVRALGLERIVGTRGRVVALGGRRRELVDDVVAVDFVAQRLRRSAKQLTAERTHAVLRALTADVVRVLVLLDGRRVGRAVGRAVDGHDVGASSESASRTRTSELRRARQPEQ